MSPSWLNTRSTAALVAGTDNTVIASRYSVLRSLSCFLQNSRQFSLARCWLHKFRYNVICASADVGAVC